MLTQDGMRADIRADINAATVIVAGGAFFCINPTLTFETIGWA